MGGSVASILVWGGGGGGGGSKSSPPSVPTKLFMYMYPICASERLRNIYMFRSQNTCLCIRIQSMQFPFFTCIWYGAITDKYTDKTQNSWDNLCICERSELRIFSHSKTAISFNILFTWYILQILCLKKHTFSGLKLQLHLQSMQFLVITYGNGAVNDSIYRQNTNIEKVYVLYMRASALGNCLHVNILKRLFLPIFCWYFRCLSAYMYQQIWQISKFYRQNFEKATLVFMGKNVVLVEDFI